MEEAIKTDDVTKIKASMDSLQKQLMEMASTLYSTQEADPEKSQEAKETSSDGNKGEEDEVIDADFTYKK